jgi:hypothetical protein
VDDASPDGTQEVARQLANVYGEDKIVRCTQRVAGSETSRREAWTRVNTMIW